LEPWIVTVICVVLVAPAVSVMVYVNTSLTVLAVARKACTVALLLSTVYVYVPLAAMVIEPNEPTTNDPTLPEADPTAPLATPLTALVSPASTSVSFVSTLPVGLVPAAPLDVPPASTAIAVSTTAVGVSLAPWIVTVI
jgi:hypothetical protein